MDMEGKKFKEKRAALFSSARQDWATPQEFFDTLNAEFNFDLDACANSENHKTPEYFDEQKNGLIQDWGALRVLQSAVWIKSNGRMDQEVFTGRRKAWYNGCYAYTSTNRYQSISRIHIS